MRHLQRVLKVLKRRFGDGNEMLHNTSCHVVSCQLPVTCRPPTGNWQLTLATLTNDLRSNPRFGVNLQQQRVRGPAVDDVRFVHAAAKAP